MSTIDDKAAALLERPSLEGLAYALRHREVWPKGFGWSYLECNHCAMGLACQLWREVSIPTLGYVKDPLDIEQEDAERLFIGLGRAINIPMRNVTPEHVADAIDALLASRA